MSLILDGTSGLSDVDGTAAAPAIRGTDTNTGIFFPAADTIAFSEGGVEAARIDASGNVGIGTSSPTAFSGFKTLELANSSGSALSLVTGSSVIAQTISSSTNGLVYMGSRSNHPLVLTTNDTERARIDSSGFLLVGTTSFNYAANGVGLRLNEYSYFTTTSATPLLLNRRGTTGTLVAMNYSDGGVGSISTNGSATAYNTSSDYRLKENIAPMTGALAKVAALKPVTYTWKASGETDEGFIAHELQEVCPSAVTGEKDAVDAEGNPQYQGIDTSFLVATLTAAIQEQQALIESLTARVVALEGN